MVEFADWRLLELPSSGDRHLIGRPIGIADSRVTSAIQAIDLKARSLTTKSGRVYQLCSPPTEDPERLAAIYAHAALKMQSVFRLAGAANLAEQRHWSRSAIGSLKTLCIAAITLRLM